MGACDDSEKAKNTCGVQGLSSQDSPPLNDTDLKQYWRAGYIERCTSGSGRGLGKPTAVMPQGGSFLLYEGKAGDDFWVKAETLLYCALIGYIHYEAPVEEQNFSTLIEFINAMEVREDDEEFKNPVDLMFDALEAEKPNHFAVRQYKKYKLAAGDVCSK